MLRYLKRAAVLAFLVGCGQQHVSGVVGEQTDIEIADPETAGFRDSENYVPALGLVASSGEVTMLQDTYFKKSTAQSSTLPAASKCLVKAGKTFKFSTTTASQNNHVEISVEGFSSCGFSTGFFYKPHVSVKLVQTFSVTTNVDTKLKISTADSATLPASEICAVAKGTKLYLTKNLEEAANNHIRVTLKEGELAACGFRVGYLYRGHLVDAGGVSGDADFARVIKHILVYEGGCSDHPADNGGRTYMGITTSRARQNGWTADVCTMPTSMVHDIYRKDYWLTRPYRFGWPLNLAVMNTEVNSGGGKAQQFLDRMSAQGVDGTLVEKASWFVDQQTDFYHRIVASNPSQNVFLRGWLNRSDYMQDVIHGLVTFAAADSDIKASPKAFSDLIE